VSGTPQLSLPGQLVRFGPGRLQDLPELVQALGASRPLVICSWRRARSDDLTRLRAALVPLVGRVPVWTDLRVGVPRPSVRSARAAYDRERADAVVSFGGGTAIDTAKAVAIGSARERRAGEGDPAARGTAVGHLAIPTTACGSAATRRFGTSVGGSLVDRWDPSILPAAVIADPELTIPLPPRPTASTGMTALAHCAEGADGERDPQAAGSVARAAAALHRSIPRAAAWGADVEARSEVLAASLVAGRSADVRPASVHRAVCLALEGLAGISGGLVSSVLLPHILRMREGSSRFAAALGVASYQEAAEVMSDLGAQMGLPRRLREIGVFEHDLEAAALRADESLQAGGLTSPSRQSLVELLRAAW
jgi:alcohol dehydrogenase class IV